MPQFMKATEANVSGFTTYDVLSDVINQCLCRVVSSEAGRRAIRVKIYTPIPGYKNIQSISFTSFAILPGLFYIYALVLKCILKNLCGFAFRGNDTQKVRT